MIAVFSGKTAIKSGKIMQYYEILKDFALFSHFLSQHNTSHFVRIRVVVERMWNKSNRALWRVLNTVIARCDNCLRCFYCKYFPTSEHSDFAHFNDLKIVCISKNILDSM